MQPTRGENVICETAMGGGAAHGLFMNTNSPQPLMRF